MIRARDVKRGDLYEGHEVRFIYAGLFFTTIITQQYRYTLDSDEDVTKYVERKAA